MSAEAELKRVAAPHVSWLVEIFMHSIPRNIMINGNLRKREKTRHGYLSCSTILFICL